jgi:hypothetical protein
MRHDFQVRAELEAQYESLTTHIAALDRDLATALDAERRLVLQEKRSELDDERRNIVGQLQQLSISRDVIIDTKPVAAIARGGLVVEYDELTRMMYELRSEVAIMKRLFDEHVRLCGAESAGFSPSVLAFLAVGGVVTLLLLAFIVIRIGMMG